VQNSREGVVVEVEGAADAIEKFISTVQADAPPLADIAGVSRVDIPLAQEPSFQIITSAAEGSIDVHSAPDSAICEECRAELFNPSDRRFRYPFINCTGCGPRLTITRDIPYDRANTSMACFPLWPRCADENENPADRRFHAEPNACPVCGPKLALYDGEGKPMAKDDVLAEAVRHLKKGAILAEIANQSGFNMSIAENSIPVHEQVRGVCEMLGFDPLFLANEGKMAVFCSPDDAGNVLAAMRAHEYGRNAAVIGRVHEKGQGRLILNTVIGGERVIDLPVGELVPRIC